jgi:hypothetical protein
MALHPRKQASSVVRQRDSRTFWVKVYCNMVPVWWGTTAIPSDLLHLLLGLSEDAFRLSSLHSDQLLRHISVTVSHRLTRG